MADPVFHGTIKMTRVTSVEF